MWFLAYWKGSNNMETSEQVTEWEDNKQTEEVAANAAGDLVESLLDETESLWDQRLPEIANQEN